MKIKFAFFVYDVYLSAMKIELMTRLLIILSLIFVSCDRYDELTQFEDKRKGYSIGIQTIHSQVHMYINDTYYYFGDINKHEVTHLKTSRLDRVIIFGIYGGKATMSIKDYDNMRVLYNGEIKSYTIIR